jgi:hypothetical protein
VLRSSPNSGVGIYKVSNMKVEEPEPLVWNGEPLSDESKEPMSDLCQRYMTNVSSCKHDVIDTIENQKWQLEGQTMVRVCSTTRKIRAFFRMRTLIQDVLLGTPPSCL